MALLSRFPGKLALAALVSALAGCAIFEAWGDGAREWGFNHRVHVADEGLDCSDCHSMPDGTGGAESSDLPGLPAQAACNLCHAELDAEKPAEKQVSALFQDGSFRAAHVSALTDELRFPHGRHVAAGVECAACHVGIDTNEHVSELPPPSMSACTNCHGELDVANECSTCHTQLSQENAPNSHEGNWLRGHGGCVRAKSGATADRCELCHTESSCSSCHFEQAPENHGGHWRLRGHGIVASMDRQSCATCHDSDSCDSCHTTMQPKNHSATWGAPIDRHCTTCHFPLRDEGCATCHVGTPSHALATPKPPTHNSAMNCRMCHGNGQPLPHVDNGDDCNYCHQ
ncbi:MAG: hypothetical protein HZA52_05835 [Planctomycetes bacterium]|nr:hypothetical protein [Planctomycetota bacterium]